MASTMLATTFQVSQNYSELVWEGIVLNTKLYVRLSVLLAAFAAATVAVAVPVRANGRDLKSYGLLQGHMAFQRAMALDPKPFT